MDSLAMRRVRWVVVAAVAMLACLIAPRVVLAADLVEVAAQVASSVVYIENGSETSPGAAPDKARVRGGSGLVIDTEGHIVTANHVVAGQSDFRVTLHDGRVLPARLIGADSRDGVAVLRVQASDLVPAKIADLRQLRLAQRVLAVGRMPDSMGNGPVVTDGIISATGKGTVKLLGHIQTTAPLLPMMGGGGLFNERGELMGINSQVWKAENAGNAIVTFAIAIDDVLLRLPELIRTGKYVRPGLGTAIGAVSAELAKALGMARAQGALVQHVEPDSNAASAGIRRGDVLVEVAGTPVETVSDVPRILRGTQVGERISIKVFREGRILSIEAVTQDGSRR